MDRYAGKGMLYIESDGEYRPLAEIEDFAYTADKSEQEDEIPRFLGMQEEMSFSAELKDTRETREFIKMMKYHERKAIKKMQQELKMQYRKQAKSRLTASGQKNTPWPEKKSHDSWWKNRSK